MDKGKSADIPWFGYFCGIVAGITYGFNPLFAKPLMQAGVSVDTMLFFRYVISSGLLGLWMLFRRETFRINWHQLWRLTLLGVFFGFSSIFLFISYNYIGAGLATTIVFMYPVLVALIMTFLRVFPTWQVWLSIVLTFIGVLILSKPSDGEPMHWQGLLLALCSALSYAIYLVIVNRSRRLRTVSSNALTFYALLIGSLIFAVHACISGSDFTKGLDVPYNWLNLCGLAIIPTMLSMLALAVSTREIGPTRTSVLGVFEPVTAIVIGTIVFSEPLTANIITGIIVTISAVLFMVVSK